VIDSLPLTNVTADTIQQESIDRISVSFPDWTDQQASNNMIALLETNSAVAEMLYAYINRMAREAFIQYALDPANVFAHAKGLGYVPKFQTPSMVSGTIVSTTKVTANTVIPAGTRFNSVQSGVYYETSQDVTMASGTNTAGPVTLLQQVSTQDTFTGSGLANQSITLNSSPVMPATIILKVNNISWNFQPNFNNSTPNSTDYTWSTTPAGVCTIAFGDGINGKKVPINATMTVAYKTGGGSAGSITANQLGSCVSTVLDAGTHATLSLAASNNLAATPGSDPETINQVRYNAIAGIKAPRVLVTRQDIEDAVAQVPGVQVASAVNWEISPNIPRYLVELFVVPIGGGQPTDVLVAAINTQLSTTTPLVMGVTAVVVPPTYTTLNFVIQVGVLPGYAQTTVNNTVGSAVQNLFDPTQENSFNFVPQFGMSVHMSQLIAILQQLPGVDFLNITAPGDTQLDINQFPVVGSITFV
jgi:hypothetical protein